MRVSKGKCKALHLEENKPMKQYGLGTACLENRFAEKDKGVPGREVEHEAWQPRRPTTSWAALPKAQADLIALSSYLMRGSRKRWRGMPLKGTEL